ncbi:MAG: peptidoglycan DD-metalloendopeptidase family protein [Muribaculaceae bacterium]|nr:peptidoglycan DD-metalloendopeptidase family protein [Muribaculaceae bacterium]MDE5958124.1 peptidoglycan DD-metalloendopeptidase family protein [Muribaculaceae bacterium]
MDKKAYYIYNPATDNFERVYPTLKNRLKHWGGILLLAVAAGAVMFVVAYFGFASRTERELREENTRLRTQYNVLQRRVDASMKVMEQIRNRDDNFYRVMMQMEPMTVSRRNAGFDYERSYASMRGMSDDALIGNLTSQIDLLDRQLYSQSQSFDQLRRAAAEQRVKLDHVPGIFPISQEEVNISSGYGMRRDPVTGTRKQHDGIDFLAPVGTSVYATADGKVAVAERKGGFGNCVEIAHGFNYLTRYAHLSELLVEEGAEVKRGDLIGKVGSSGKSTTPHLHYEVIFKGEAENPINYFYLDLTPDDYAIMLQQAEDAGQVLD